jgi:3-(3-hydroxy-phenyl)propionate hydroxylase
VRRLDDLLKPEFTVVTATQEAMSWISERSLLSWRHLGGERIVIASTGESAMGDGVLIVVEGDGIFSNWIQENQVSAVIVRPDRYVFAGASNADELNVLMGNLIGALYSRS